MYHKILERQLTKFLGTTSGIPKELIPFINAINTAYENYDKDRALLARSFEISTRELEKANQELLGQAKSRETVLDDLNRTKAAMINLLEDLKEEKSLVEEKIVERTRELRDEHARFLAAANSLPLGFVTVDDQKNVVLSNPAIRMILEIGRQEMQFADLEAALGPYFDLKKDVDLCISNNCESNVKDIDMGKKIVRCFLSPVKGSDAATVIGAVILVEDVTEQRLLERSREEFFAIASHELRTPLTAIRGNMSMLEDFYADKITDPDMKQMIEDSITACGRLIKIVNDFLDTSRLEQNRIKFDAVDFSAYELVEEVAKELKELAMRKKVSLSTHQATLGVIVTADRDRAKQVLVNLVGNAINYTAQGEVKITLETTEGKYAKFLVEDTGIGIAPQNQTLLFKKFQQAGKSYLARDVTQGTGLGLYISKLIINSMGGAIWLERSVSNQGSLFGFTLPLALPKP